MATENRRPFSRENGEGRTDRNNSDRPNKDREGKKIFNRRDKADRNDERGERRSFNPDRNQGDRREGRSGDDRRFSRERRDGGERSSFNSDRRNNDRRENREGDNRRFSREKNEGGERRTFSNDREDRRTSDRDRTKRYERERRPSDAGHFDKRPERRDGERRSFGNNRSADRRDDRHSDNRSFDRERPRREDGDRRTYGNDRREGGERRSFNNDRPERRDDRRGDDRRGDMRSFDNDRPRRAYDGDKKPQRENRAERLGKQAFSRDRFSKPNDGEQIQDAPNYNLSRYKDNPRIKKSEREKEDDGTVRLNRYIANAGVCSRREADVLIESGEIKVNGEVVTEMGYKVQPTDNVQYGKKVLNREKMVYVLLNKPKDFITTTEDPEGRKTVMSLVASASKERIFPVGRLDRNTTGLLLFTNDGELAQKLTHPSNAIKKIYQVELDKPITKADFQKIAEGLELEDGKVEVDDIALLGESNKFLGIEIHVGRNRIVRRIFEHLGYDVVSLDRVQYASLTKKDVPRGNWRYLTEKEVVRLKYFM